MIKKSFLFLSVMVLSMGLFTACNNDDKAPSYPIDEVIAGTYKGALSIVVDGQELAKEIPQKITISKVDDTNVKLELKNFNFMGLPIGDITISPCELTQIGEAYSFYGAQTLDLQSVGKCDVDVKGTIVGGKISANIGVGATIGGIKQVIAVTFGGAKMSGTESKEAKITSFTIKSDVVATAPVIDEATGKITFTVVKGTTDDKLKFTPTIVISDKATISPAIGVEQNFVSPVTYTVSAEDGTTKVYTVSILGKSDKYNFDEWTSIILDPSTDPVGYPALTNVDWATSNQAFVLIKAFGPMLGFDPTTPYPILESASGYAGSGATITTYNTIGGMGGMVPTITAGTLFTGVFNINPAMVNALLCTEFGIPYIGEPVALRGWYKYAPGAEYFSVPADQTIDKAVVDPSKKDACSIVAVLYDVTNDPSKVYTGVDLNKSENVVLRAELTNENKVGEWTSFTIPFEAKNGFVYDAAKTYKLAIVCSSSKDGAQFGGAPGSVLSVDEFEIISK